MLPSKSSLRRKIIFSYLLVLLPVFVVFSATSPFQRIETTLLILFGIFILGIAIAFLLSKKIISQLEQFLFDVDQINNGHLDHRTQVPPSNDLYPIGQGINAMADKLQKAQHHQKQIEGILQQTRDELEIRVEKRTAELKREVEDKLLLEEKYRKVMDASPVPITVFDMDGKPIYINRAFTQTFGWALEEFQDQPTNYIPAEEYDLNIAIRKKIFKGQGGYGVETRRYNSKGQLLDVNLSFDVWRDKNNVPIGCVVILHDVTQSKKMEQQLFQSRKMEAMGTLAGGIAHDFNNILSGIFAFSQLAQKHAGNQERAKSHIHQIVKGAQRASRLVQQILTFCRKTEYQKQAIRFDLVVTETLDLFAPTLPSTITLEHKIDSNLVVMADETQIHQVILNLCTNAHHAMDNTGGRLTIALNRIEILPHNSHGNQKPGDYACLEIQDTGHGMDQEVLEKAFDPYFTTKEVGKGTGFGLALVKAIIEAHGGFITVDSTPGEGSAFRVYLPRERYQMVQDRRDGDSTAIVGGDEHIMVVDDEESIRLATREFLEDYGYTATTFEDGESALEAFKKEPRKFDLVFTDMTMPKMTGDDLARELLEIKPELPIILSTGYSEKITESQALQTGIKFFVQKPVANLKLDAMIRSLLD